MNDCIVSNISSDSERQFQVMVIWNREFDYTYYGGVHTDLNTAKKSAISIRDLGDGARVKKVKVVDIDIDKVVWIG